VIAAFGPLIAIAAPAVGAAPASVWISQPGRPQTMSRRKRTLLIALVAAVIGSATLASWHFYLRSLVTVPEKFTRVKDGMTRQEVIAILGPPAWTIPQKLGIAAHRWDSGRWSITVIFDNDKVAQRDVFQTDDSLYSRLWQLRRWFGF
jgi:hypothetical protein